MKIRNRLSWLVSLTAAGIFLLYGWSIYELDSKFYYEEFYKRLEERMVMVETEYKADPHEFENDDWNDPLDAYYEDKELAVVLDEDGSQLLKEILNQEWKYPLTEIETFRFEADQKQGVGKIITDNGEKVALLVLASDKDGDEKLNFLKRSLFLEGTIAVFLLVLVMRFEISRLLMPLENKIKRASIISADRLNLRLQVKNPEDEIGKVALAFNKMLDRLETAFEAQKQFVRNASHEIKNPLTAIKGEIEILLQKERSLKEYKAALSIISAEADRLEILTHQLLDLEKVNAIDEINDPEIFSLEQTILEVVEKFPPQLVKLSLVEAENSCFVKGKSNLLLMALSNLVENGLKYSNNIQVEIRFNMIHQQGIITIIDQGIGIPTDEIKKIFQPLYRASNALFAKGHGIGLSLTKKIIELHGGTINLDSIEGRGTIVTITIPRLEF
ncbi:MAG: sensor histidine kinase [Saprospiraceae bacterium]